MKHSINNSMPSFTGTPIVDLHVHSTCSDGTFTPTELVDYAIKKGLSAFALTDHDTTDGLEEAMEFINDDEMLEITPKNVRLRKKTLDTETRLKRKAKGLE